MTSTKWRNMSKDAQNAFIHRRVFDGSAATAESVRGTQELGLYRIAPDFCGNLDDMWMAERVADDRDKYFWQKWIPNFVRVLNLGRPLLYQDCLRATVEQRAEAFVLTVDPE